MAELRFRDVQSVRHARVSLELLDRSVIKPASLIVFNGDSGVDWNEFL